MGKHNDGDDECDDDKNIMRQGTASAAEKISGTSAGDCPSTSCRMISPRQVSRRTPKRQSGTTSTAWRHSQSESGAVGNKCTVKYRHDRRCTNNNNNFHNKHTTHNIHVWCNLVVCGLR